jgi:hypothetical protein
MGVQTSPSEIMNDEASPDVDNKVGSTPVKFEKR